MSDSVSGSVKADIFFETDRLWLEMVLVNFLESSCSNLYVSEPDFIQHCKECITCTAIIITIPYESRRWGRIIGDYYYLSCLCFFGTYTQILSFFKFSLFAWLDRHTAFGCNKSRLNVCSLSLNFFLLFLVNYLLGCICYHRWKGQRIFDRPFQCRMS